MVKRDRLSALYMPDGPERVLAQNTHDMYVRKQL